VYLITLALAMADAVLDDNAETTKEPQSEAQIADPSAAVLPRSLFADLLGELEITFDRGFPFGPLIPRWSTQTFPFRLVRDLTV